MTCFLPTGHSPSKQNLYTPTSVDIEQGIWALGVEGGKIDLLRKISAWFNIFLKLVLIAFIYKKANSVKKKNGNIKKWMIKGTFLLSKM